MNNKGVTTAIVIMILVVIAGVYVAAQSTGSDNNIPNMFNNTSQNVSQQNITTNNSTNTTNSTNNMNSMNNSTVVSAQQAKQIAQVYILESGARADDPTLITWSDGKLAWEVPVINSSGQKEDVSIYIDAQTGARLRQNATQ